ncbi:MAG TPA: rhodanese-like domain-containing protein [Streptosporangiaceae bacterium]|nr:rhodanese-like domain-containing protein [Streptosporangiaceae bacterium]
MRPRSKTLEHPPATPPEAAAYFSARMAYETDCSDVGADIAAGVSGFVVVDCRSPELYAAGHVPGAVNIPHRQITGESIAALLPAGDLVVTYCNGPHCNAAARGALRLAALGRRVKEMHGGMDGWLRERLPVEMPGPRTPSR